MIVKRDVIDLSCVAVCHVSASVLVGVGEIHGGPIILGIETQPEGCSKILAPSKQTHIARACLGVLTLINKQAIAP